MTFRVVRDLLFNSALAVIGVIIVEEAVYPVYRPTTIVGVYEKEFLLSAGVAFGLGFLVYFRWQYRTALWVWVLGACVYAGRLALYAAHAPLVSGDAATLGLVSIRAVFYSVGAVACRWTVRRDTPRPEAPRLLSSAQRKSLNDN
jgi:hypothetical protein